MTLSQLVDDDPEPVQWLAAPWIAPGRPTLIYGPKDVAKSLVAYDLALAASYGRRWLGSIPIQRRGRVVVLDYEPKVPPKVRIQQLIDFDPRGPWPMAETDLEVHPIPRWKLSDWREAQARLEVICRDTALLIIDSLAAATPGLDERGNEYRITLDMLTEVSTTTGAAVVVVHHEGIAKGRPRGHTGVSQACGTEIHLSKAGNRITMTAASAGAMGAKPAPVTVELTAGPVSARTGLAETIRLRPPEKKDGKVLAPDVPAWARTASKPKKSQPSAGTPTDADLLRRARATFGDSLPGINKIATALGIGQARAKRVKLLLQEGRP